MKKLLIIALLFWGCEDNTKWEHCTLSSVYQTSFDGWWIYDLHGDCEGEISRDVLSKLNKEDGYVIIMLQLGKKGWQLIDRYGDLDKINTGDSILIAYEFKRKK